MRVESFDGCHNQSLAECLKPNENESQLEGLYLINTRLWLSELKQKYGQETTIGSIPDEEWNKLFDKYDSFWFMGIYKPSEFSQEHAKKYCYEYAYALPDINKEKDVVASPFAIPEYAPNPLIAKDWDEWDKTINKIQQKGKKVFVDFVPNHTALEHAWTKEHPEYYIQGTEEQYSSNQNFYHKVIDNTGQTKYLAHGKDPNYPEWADTLQLNYAKQEVQNEMKNVLLELTKHANGVRCDMAMLLNPETFLRTWGWTMTNEEKDYIKNNDFWEKTIPKIKNEVKNDFKMIAEAYWDKEQLRNNFDYIYCDDFYKHLKRVANGESPIYLKSHVKYLLDNKNKKCRDVLYVENHDEDRAIKTMGSDFSKTATVLCAMINNSIFMVNQGQENGFQIRPPMQISRYPAENENKDMAKFYDDLLKIRRSKLFQTGEFKILETNNDEKLITLEINKNDEGTRAIVCVNVGQTDSYCELNINEEKINIYNLTNGEYCPAERITEEKIITKLEADEVKIVYLTKY